MPTVMPTEAAFGKGPESNDLALFATLGMLGCATELQYGPEKLLANGSESGIDNYFFTHPDSNIQHQELVQVLLDAYDFSELFSILWVFPDVKSVSDRLVDAVVAGINIEFYIHEPGYGESRDVALELEGVWRFSSTAGASASTFHNLNVTTCCLSSGTGGAWGASAGTVDGND